MGFTSVRESLRFSPAPGDTPEPCEGRICQLKNDLTVAVEVCGEQWHVLYPKQIKTIRIEASLNPEVFVRLREDHEIQSKIRIEDVSAVFNVPQDFGDSFQDRAKHFIDNQVKEAEEELRLSDERQKAITKKVNNAINRAAYRRQGCLYLCMAVILSALLCLLIVCTIASFGFDGDASEQYGLGFAMVLLLYCACAGVNGFVGSLGSGRTGSGRTGSGGPHTATKKGNLSNDIALRVRQNPRLQDYEAHGMTTRDDEWSCRCFISRCCEFCVCLITFVCAVVFSVGSVVRSVDSGNGENWWLIVFLLIAFLLCGCHCLSAWFDFDEDRCYISLRTCVVTTCGVCAMVVLVHGWLRAPESGTWMPPPIFGWTCLLMLCLVLVFDHDTNVRYPMLLVAWCFGMEIEDFEASLVAPARSALDATVLGVHQGTIVFEGSVLPNAPTIVSWPGKYESKWGSLVNEARQKDVSAAVVFLPEGSEHFGVHDWVPHKYWYSEFCLNPVRDQCDCQCWCYWLYGERRKPWGCRWWTHWIRNVELAVKNGNTLEVYFFDAKRGQGKVQDFKTAGKAHKRREEISKKKAEFLRSVKYGQALADGLGRISTQNGPDSSSPFSREVHRLFLEWLSDKDRQFLDDSEGLGNSQKAEVAWLDMHKYTYVEKEVAEFNPGGTDPSPQTIGRGDSERQLLPRFTRCEQV